MRPIYTNPANFVFAFGFVAAGCGDNMDMNSDMMPKAPSDLAVMELGGGAHLTWKDNATNEEQFMLERKAGAGAFSVIATLPFNTVQFHDAPLMPSVTYAYRVMAMGKEPAAAEQNEYSNVVTLTLASATGTGGTGTGGTATGGHMAGH